jgi:hypothetical protein
MSSVIQELYTDLYVQKSTVHSVCVFLFAVDGFCPVDERTNMFWRNKVPVPFRVQVSWLKLRTDSGLATDSGNILGFGAFSLF